MKVLIGIPTPSIGGFSTFALNVASEFKRLGGHTGLLTTSRSGSLADEFAEVFDRVFVEPPRFLGRKYYVSCVERTLRAFAPDLVINNAVGVLQAALLSGSQQGLALSVVHSIEESEVRLAGLGLPSVGVACVATNIVRVFQESFPEHVPAALPVGVIAESVCGRQFRRHVAEPFVLSYVGRLSPRFKNLATLADVIELSCRLEQVTVQIVGTGESEPWLRSRLRRLIDERRVVLSGAVSPKRVRELLSASDALILTSTAEGTPHAILEAMAVGCVPVVSLIEGSTTEIVTDGFDGFLCDPESTGQFVQRLEGLVMHPTLNERLGLAAMETVRSRFDIADTVENLLQSATKLKPPVTPIELGSFYPGGLGAVRLRIGSLLRRAGWHRPRIPEPLT